MFKILERDIQNILDSIIEITYFMRGGVQYEELLLRTPFERDRMHAYIQKRIDGEMKKPMQTCVY